MAAQSIYSVFEIYTNSAIFEKILVWNVAPSSNFEDSVFLSRIL